MTTSQMATSSLSLRAMLLSLLLLQAEGLKILLFNPAYGKSHALFSHRLAETLDHHGHDVTLFSSKDTGVQIDHMMPKDGIKEISVYHDWGDTYHKSMQQHIFEDISLLEYASVTYDFWHGWLGACEAQFNVTNTRLAELSAAKFDVAIYHSFDICPIGLADRIGIEKTVFVSDNTYLMEIFLPALGFPLNPSYVPSLEADMSDRMSFGERFENLLHVFAGVVTPYWPRVPLSIEIDMIQSYNLPNPIDSIKKKTVGYLVNGEQNINFPRPLPSNGGYMGMIGDPKTALQTEDEPLTDFWQDLYDSSVRGVIIVSFGTMADPTKMPESVVMALLHGLGSFSNHTVIWKFNADLPAARAYPNVHLVNWLPQRQLLRHPKTAAFVTHAGYNSLLESTRAGVPMVLVPLFVDQYGNAMRALRLGVGVKLDKAALTPQTVADALHTVVDDPSYRARARHVSSTFDDRPLSQGAELSHRLETMLKDALRPIVDAARQLTLWQTHSLDVLSVLALCLATASAVVL